MPTKKSAEKNQWKCIKIITFLLKVFWSRGPQFSCANKLTLVLLCFCDEIHPIPPTTFTVLSEHEHSALIYSHYHYFNNLFSSIFSKEVKTHTRSDRRKIIKWDFFMLIVHERQTSLSPLFFPSCANQPPTSYIQRRNIENSLYDE